MNKKKNTCGNRVPASCVFYDLNVPEYSKLDKEECLVIEETTEDLYNLVTWIKESIDLKNFEKDCLEVDDVEDTYNKDKRRFLIKDVIIELKNKMCELEGRLSDDSDDTLELDFKCLVGPCGDPITSLKDLLQVLINKHCPEN